MSTGRVPGYDPDRVRPPGRLSPSDPHRIVAVAGAADDRPRLQAASDVRVRRLSESSHPERSQLIAAADAARSAHDRGLDHAHRERRDRLARSDATGRPVDPTAWLADAERDVAGTQQAPKAARTRIEQLRQEPAFSVSRPIPLSTERARQGLEDAAARPPVSPSAPPRLVIRPPGPEDVRHLARHPDAGRGTPR